MLIITKCWEERKLFKLKAIELENFRSFKNKTSITFDNLTTIIGKNDAGKSTILEALEIFFNNETVKIDQDDVNVFSEDKKMVISCIFESSDEPIVLDEEATTTLNQEFLLNKNGDFQIIKEFDGSLKNIKADIYIKAMYPKQIEEPIINFSNSQLKKYLKDNNIEDPTILKNSNVSIRQGIYNHIKNTHDIELVERKIELNKQDGKKLWENIQKHLPMFALFKADRSSNDEDSEVQDPMKVAVAQALKEVESDLENIKQRVQSEALSIANNTLKKLKEMDENLANELIPNFTNEPKWANIFKLSLESEHGIPINKRGSGVRRLILLNFFRSEVERKRVKESRGVIYAIEEPETAQHPHNQRMLIEALKELANNNCQIIITTHVPGVAEMLPIDSIRFISDETKQKGNIINANEDQLIQIAEELGVLPSTKVRLLVYVEGKNDVMFLKHISKILYSANKTNINLFTDNRIAFIPTGGVNSLKDFINNKYLRSLGLPEIYIVDRDEQNDKKVKKAIVTKRREMENYIHPSIIKEFLINKYPDLKEREFNINFSDPDLFVPEAIHNLLKSNNDVLGNVDVPSVGTIKNWLNSKVVSKMNYNHLIDLNVAEELEDWFKIMEERLESLSFVSG